MFLISLQHPGRFYEELPNTADYVSYRLACNKEDYPEPYSPPINPPLSFLPQQPYQTPQTLTMPTLSSSSTSTPSKNTFLPPSHSTTIFKYPSVPGLSSPPPGVGPYTFPKEQYVWRTSLQALPLRNNRNCRSNLKEEEEEEEFMTLSLMDQRSKVTGCSVVGLLKWFVWFCSPTCRRIVIWYLGFRIEEIHFNKVYHRWNERYLICSNWKDYLDVALSISSIVA